jgi:hypothetical protein
MIEIIPEIHTHGSINPHTLFVDLNGTSRAEIEKARKGGGAPRGWEVYEHEARHWLDLVSTVWGRGYLDLLFRTYDAILTTPAERMDQTFETVLELFDKDRSILFPSYYKYVLPEAQQISASGRWSMSFSTGVKIDSGGRHDDRQPFIFVRFAAGGAHFARQPVSEGSLLEARAFAAETAAVAEWLTNRPTGEDVVEWKLRDAEQRALLYDPHLTTYSVAAHVTANATGINQIRDNLALTNKLADIALNLTDANFSALRLPKEFENLGVKRHRGFCDSRNRGYAFSCLAFGLRAHVGSVSVGRSEIDLALRSVGLPASAKLYADARSVIDRMPGPLAREPRLAEIRGKLIEAGRRLHCPPQFDAPSAALCPDGDDGAPLVVDSECEVFSLGTPPLSYDQSEFLFDCEQRYRDVLRSALRAARGLEFELTDYVY